MRLTRDAFTITIILFLLFNFAYGQSRIDNLAQRFKREIPVELYEGWEAKFSVRGEAVLECFRGTKLSEIYYFSTPLTIKYRENGIEVDDEDGQLTIGLAEIRFKPRMESSLITFNDRAYRGSIRVRFLGEPGGLLVINLVDIEDYLKGVLPGEIGDRTSDEYEAVKAQAIAARTYAVWKLTDRSTSGKLAPTVADQLYTGIDSEKEFLSNGIDDTQGEILTFKDLPIASFYHAVCGGYTAPVEHVWPERHPEPYLVGTNDDSYCAWAKSFSWTETFALPRLKEALEKYFVGKGTAGNGSFDEILDIDFENDPETGRVKTMKVTTGAGVFSENCDRIRWALGRPSIPGAILPSTNFRVEKQLDGEKLNGIKINGTGNGHGVGMCQCGAIGRSRAGEKYAEILKTYFKHTKITKLY